MSEEKYEEVTYEANLENVTQVAEAIMAALDQFPDMPVLDILTAIGAVDAHLKSASGIIAMLTSEEE